MEIFISSINEWHWFGLATILGILEVTLGASFFLLWLALSAATIGVILIMVPTLGWQYQLLIFAVESIACIFFWYVHLKNSPIKTDRPTLNRRNEQYINRVFTLVEPIVNGRGKIQVDDSFWIVEGQDLPLGKHVRVVGVNGVVLKVEEDL